MTVLTLASLCAAGGTSVASSTASAQAPAPAQSSTTTPELIVRVREAARNLELARARKAERSDGPGREAREAREARSGNDDAKAKGGASAAGAFRKDAFTLGRIASLLEERRMTEARDALARLDADDMDESLLPIYGLLGAETMQALGRPEAALPYLDVADENRQGKEFETRIVNAKLVAAAEAGMPTLAAERHARDRAAFETDFLQPDVEAALYTLARRLLELGNPMPARDILVQLMRNYPLGEVPRKAYQTFADAFCDQGDLDTLWGDARQRREHARNVIRRVGPLADVRAFALALAGVSKDAPVPNVHPDKLVPAEKAELLELADFLLSIREYELGLKVTSYLKQAKAFGEGFKRDRTLFLHARALNSNQQPEGAATYYKQVYSEYARSEFAATARTRYVLSLHYAKRFKDVAKESRALIAAGARGKETRWRAFWADYLTGDRAQAELSGKAISDAADRTRVQYWLGRMQERAGNAQAARKVYEELDGNASHTHYSVLARWRTALLEDGRRDDGAVRLAARAPAFALRAFPIKIDAVPPPELSDLKTLVDAGLAGFARERLALRMRSERKPDRVLALSRLAFHAGDYKLASLGPRRTFRQLSRIPETRADLRKAMDESRELWQLSFPLAYSSVVEAAAAELSISPFLVLGVMRAESNYDRGAVSNVGARGLMQIMPLTGNRISQLMGYEGFTPADLDRPEMNIAFGAWYLKRLVTYYKGNFVLAIAAYNAGPEAVDRWIQQAPDFELDEFIENIPFDQTRNYVAKVMLNMEMYARLYGSSGKGLEIDLQGKLPKPVNGMEMF